MINPNRPILLDITRLIATGWMRRQATGIDRVCDAYLERYRNKALAVIQFRGLFRILSEKHSAALFALLVNRDKWFRFRLLSFIIPVIAFSKSNVKGDKSLYINVSHTDFDLKSHQKWVQHCKLRAIYMIHDLIPINNKEYCTPHATKRHTGRVKQALSHAAGIIVNSKATKLDLMDYAEDNGISAPPILVSHLGSKNCDTISKKPDRITHTSLLKTYFVTLGTIEHRKNHMLLLRIWIKLISKLEENTPQLIIIGQRGSSFEAVDKVLKTNPILEKYVTILNECTDQETFEWIESAKAVLLPTLAEGYGFPLIEAMTLKTPVIASDLACFREIGGNIPLFIESNNDSAWEAAILCLLNSSKEERRQAGLLSDFVTPRWVDHFEDLHRWLGGMKGEILLQETQSSSMQKEVLDVGNISYFADNDFNNILERKVSQNG